LKWGRGIYNSFRDKEECVGRMLLMHVNSREDVKEVNVGDIVVLVGVKYSITG
jgi:Translation elongation factors (GTPases)